MDEVRRLRKLQGLSQVELAERAGVSAYTITEIETGHREPRPSTLRKLADALDTEIADFFPKVPRPSLTQLLEKAGANTRWLAVPVDELREATSGRDDDEKKAKLIKIARESLLEWQALQPLLLSGWHPLLERRALEEEDKETWNQATQRVIKIYKALEKLRATSEEHEEYEKEATELVEEFRGLSLVL